VNVKHSELIRINYEKNGQTNKTQDKYMEDNSLSFLARQQP